jgi:hypothetical protein
MTRPQELSADVLQALAAADRKPGWNNRPREVKRFALGGPSTVDDQPGDPTQWRVGPLSSQLRRSMRMGSGPTS